MSFDWLNIPGINTNDSNVAVESGSYLPPPNVSFNVESGSSNNEQNAGSRPIEQVASPSVPSDRSTRSGNSNQTPQHHQSDPSSSNHLDRQDHRAQHQSHHKHGQRPHSQTEVSYRESPEELRVPLSLSRSQLTREEVRTYLRWYNYITSRTHYKLVKLVEVFKFLANFRLSEELKVRIETIFRTCKNALNIGQFFAVLRLVSKALIENVMPNRRMILEKAPIPAPRPILSSNDRHEIYEEVEEDPDANEQKVDFDSFASLLLTGKSVQKRIRRRIPDSLDKNKRVRFSEHLTFQEPPSEETEGTGSHEVSDEEENDDKLDLSLPMDQLLKRMAKRKEKNSALVSSMPSEQQETEEEKEELADMKDSLSHFKQIQTVDFASIAPGQLPSIKVDDNNNGNGPNAEPLQPLKPTSTGSANSLFRQHYNQTTNGDYEQPLQPLKPTATGSANYLVRNHVPPQQEAPSGPPNGTSPVGGLQPLRPTATGSGNYLLKQQLGQQQLQGQQLQGQQQQGQHQMGQQQQGQQQMSQQQIGQQHLAQQQSGQQQIGQQQMGQQPLAQQYSSSGLTSPANGAERYPSPQHTGQLPTDQYLHAPQPRMSMQQQLSPQVTPQQDFQQHQNMLPVPPNPAGSYFQSLLSNSPSPNPSNLNLSNMPNRSSPYQYPPNNLAPTSQSRAMYNEGYPYSNPPPGRQQQMFTGPPHQPQQQGFPQQGYTSNLAPSRPYTMPNPSSPQSGDILSDLHSLQQQVDALHNTYRR